VHAPICRHGWGGGAVEAAVAEAPVRCQWWMRKRTVERGLSRLLKSAQHTTRRGRLGCGTHRDHGLAVCSIGGGDVRHRGGERES
jgi:hypothetical protein